MSFLNVLIISLPILISSFISITRVLDNRHRASDVLSGAAIGAIFAWLGFRVVVVPSDIFKGDTRQEEPEGKLLKPVLRNLPSISSETVTLHDEPLAPDYHQQQYAREL
jgi:hypothetical protein